MINSDRCNTFVSKHLYCVLSVVIMLCGLVDLTLGQTVKYAASIARMGVTPAVIYLWLTHYSGQKSVLFCML